MASRKHYTVIVGARPNFVKAAPFFHEARKRDNVDVSLIHTGQHFDANMSKIFFEEMGIPRPEITLAVQGTYHTEKIGKMFNSLQSTLASYVTDGVIVFGDVNSTLAGALAALKHKVPLIHVEAGLRSHDRRMPEEINRVIVDHISELLFTTEPAANENLTLEGISSKQVHYVGNIMTETIELFWERSARSRILEELALKRHDYAVVTIHRQENTDDKMNLRNILNLLQGIVREVEVVFPLHPGTKKKISEFGLDHLLAHIRTIEPVGYFDFMKLLMSSKGVITDSGGIQEETSYLGIPCATLRDNTERPVTLTLGTNKLFPTDAWEPEKVIEHLNRSFLPARIPLWGSGVSGRIFDVLERTSEIQGANMAPVLHTTI